jgi:hypothetical protein
VNGAVVGDQSADDARRNGIDLTSSSGYRDHEARTDTEGKRAVGT